MSIYTSLGACCGCGKDGALNIMMLPRRGPTPGRGWGCVECGLPPDGATAVLCEPCAERWVAGDKDAVRWVCTGYPATDGRTLISDCPQGKFAHDRAKHQEDFT